MKLHAIILALAVVFACTLVVLAAPTTHQFTKDNIGDILLALGTTPEEIVDIDAFVAEINERSAAAEKYSAHRPELTDNVQIAELRKSAYYTSIARCLNWGPKSVVNWSCTNCKKTPKVTNVFTGEGKKSELAWFIGYTAEDNEIVVTARSSTTIQNWVYDLDFKSIDVAGCPDCKVHQGFYKAYMEVRNDYLDSIFSISTQYPTAKVRVQGHSLAAATAYHTVLDLITGSFSKIELTDGKVHWHSHSNPAYNSLSDDEFLTLAGTPGTTIIADTVKFELTFPFFNFGSPRVGNQAWAQFFQNTVGPTNTKRSTHLNDPVPRVPPREILGHHFQHPSNELYWYADSKYKTCNDFDREDPKCALGNLLPVVITDHMWYAGILLACIPN